MNVFQRLFKKDITVKSTIEYKVTQARQIGHRMLVPGDKIIYAEVTKTVTVNRFERAPIEIDVVAELLYPLAEAYDEGN